MVPSSQTGVLQPRTDCSEVPTPDACLYPVSSPFPAPVPSLTQPFLGSSLGSCLGHTVPSLCASDSPVIVSTSRIYLENKTHTSKVQGVKPGLSPLLPTQWLCDRGHQGSLWCTCVYQSCYLLLSRLTSRKIIGGRGRCL